VLTPSQSQQARGGAPCSTSTYGGQTALEGRSDRGRRVHRRETNERPPGRDPVGVGAPWVVLGLAG
jgi:hypothetical protein